MNMSKSLLPWPLLICLLPAVIAAQPLPSPVTSAVPFELHSPSEQAEAEIAARLRALAGRSETPELRTWVESWLNYQEVSRKPHPERDSMSLPRFAIQALARHVLERWELHAAQVALHADSSSGLKSPSTRFQRQARLLWLESAPASEVQAFSLTVKPAELDEASLLLLLRRVPTLELWRELARRGSGRQSLHALQGAADQLPAEQYQELLRLAAQNPALASTSARLQGAWAGRDASRQTALIDMLDTVTWDTPLVETLLAADIDGLTQIMTRHLQQPAHAPLAAYTLWRIGTAQAMASLQTYLHSPQALPDLAEEIRQWVD